MIVVDSNVLSTFARVEHLELLFRLFPKDPLGVPPAVHDELAGATRLGCRLLEPAAEMMQDRRLRIIPLTPDEIVAAQSLPRSFAAADAQCIIGCRRRGYALPTNDRRVRNFCRSEGTRVFDLPELLRALWENGVLSIRRVRRLVDQMELAENLVVRNKDEIFRRRRLGAW